MLIGSSKTKKLKINFNQNPSDDLAKVFKVLERCISVVGISFLRPNFRKSLYNYVIYGFQMAYISTSFYTFHYLGLEKWTELIESFGSFMAGLQCFIKYASVLHHIHNIHNMMDEIKEIYSTVEQRGERYRICLKQNSKKLLNILKAVSVVYTVTAITMIVVPIIFTLTSGRVIWILYTLIPGVNTKTSFGYYVTSLYHFLGVFAAGFGLFASDMLSILLGSQGFMFSDILKLQVEDLNELLENKKKEDEDLIQRKLLDILKWQQKSNRFTEKCNEVNFYLITTQFTFSTSLIFSLLFAVLYSGSFGSYTFLFMHFLLVYMFSILGTKLSVADDSNEYEIYNITWYHLSVSQQKIVRSMLMKAQNPNILRVGGVIPLTVRTAFQITKTAYSFAMMVIQFKY